VPFGRETRSNFLGSEEVEVCFDPDSEVECADADFTTEQSDDEILLWSAPPVPALSPAALLYLEFLNPGKKGLRLDRNGPGRSTDREDGKDLACGCINDGDVVRAGIDDQEVSFAWSQRHRIWGNAHRN
jgi:hypothetical protein